MPNLGRSPSPAAFTRCLLSEVICVLVQGRIVRPQRPVRFSTKVERSLRRSSALVMPFARAISSNASPNAGRANERRTLKQMMLPIAAEKVGRETHTPRTGRFAGAWLIASGLSKPRARLFNQSRTSRSSVRCSRLIVTSWISLPPRVRLAIFKHSASSQALLLVRFCCSFLFCLMDEGLGNLGV